MAKWQARDWPGNMRELRNFADRLVLVVAESAPGVVGAVVNPAPVIESLPQQIDGYERTLIADALKSSDGNVATTAERLGVPKKTL